MILRMGDLFSIEVSDRPFFLARGKVRVKEIDAIELPKILGNLVMTHKDIRESYQKYFSEDSKLVGQEKAHLLEQIASMITSVVEMRMYLEKKVFGRNIAESKQIDPGFEFRIFLRNYEFTINGFYSQKLFEKIPGFQVWENVYYLPTYGKLISIIKSSIADGKISEEEGRNISNLLDEVLNLLVIIFSKLETEFVHD